MWQLPVGGALVAATGRLLPSAAPSIVAWLLAVAGLTLFGISSGKMIGAVSWMMSLRRLVNYSPIPRGMSTTRYAKSVLAGTRAVGKLEAALTTIWAGDGDVDQARQVLSGRGVPDVSTDDYERKDGPCPVWQRHGVAWQDAPLPDVDHTCTGWTIAVLNVGTEKSETTVFCACGAVQYPDIDNLWGMRNRRRRESPAQP